MPSLFSRLKSRDGKSKKKHAINDITESLPPKRQWDDAWTRNTVEPEEIHELLRFCVCELKARGLDHPFFLLPFRPTSDPSAVRTFVRHFFDNTESLKGETLAQELRMTEPMVISGVTKWCWGRLQGGIVGWDAYELFKVGEFDSNMARDSFNTFIPISVENGARQRIIFDFFDLMAAIAAHGKVNGFGGGKLSRMAAWWAFEQKDTGNGFEGGYNAWLTAADATSHLFFAYLRSLSPEQTSTGISMLPRSLQKLLQDTEYPPQRPHSLMMQTNKLVMVVDNVSPTPFALLRRANHFQYRDSDRELQEFSEFQDPVQALTEECRRVLKAISAANQSQVSSSKHSTSLRDASWSRFEDIGFASALEEEEDEDESALAKRKPQPMGIRSTPASGNGLGRPVTPSWADFLSSGFVDDNPTTPNLLLPPDKVLPPIDVLNRQQSSQSHRPRLESDQDLEPAELASITLFNLDDSFWWVWMNSLAPEESSERKAAFGRCAVIETTIRSGHWLVMEEMVAGAAPEPQEGAYLAEKKGLFSWTRRRKSVARRKSPPKFGMDRNEKNATNNVGISTISVGPDAHAKVQAKAAQLRAISDHDKQAAQTTTQRRGRTDADVMAEKTNSVFTLQPNIAGEASSAMKWVSKYDKGTIKDAYMSNNAAGRGSALSLGLTDRTNGHMAGSNWVPDSNGGAPEVPPKESSPTPAAPLTPEKDQVESNDASNAKTEEAGIHPLERAETQVSPTPPMKDDEPEVPNYENMPTSESGALNSENKRPEAPPAKTGGFRRLFSRKNRSSKLPPSASSDLNNLLRKDQTIHESSSQATSTAAATPSPVPGASNRSSIQPETPIGPGADTFTEDRATTPTQEVESRIEPHPEPAMESPAAMPVSEPTYQPSEHESLSRIDTGDAAEARNEFSRFDQGPLPDQPAFAPAGDDDEDDAMPPPIARSSPREPQARKPVADKIEVKSEEKLSQSASPGVQDRWAQIRKNAANRAATRPSGEHVRPPPAKTSDGDDDTSGEETIESRVARIKARVAELTGNMEGTNGPQQQQQQPIPARR